MGDAALERPRFDWPDYSAPLHVAPRAARCPVEGAVKGMFFQSIIDEVARRGGRRVGRDRYVAFRGYPLREWLELLPEAAVAAYPALGPREGMRRFGQRAFDVFTASMAGRVLFSMAGRNVRMAVSLTGRAFDVIGSHGAVSVLENDEGRAVFGLSDMWDYIDAWHVGVYEGALAAFGLTGEVRVRMHDLANGDLELIYRRRT